MTTSKASAPTILVLNSGSSSLKFAFFGTNPKGETPLGAGEIEKTGNGGGRLWFRALDGTVAMEKSVPFADPSSGVNAVLEALVESGLGEPSAVGHRLVHGGPRFLTPQRVDATLIGSLRALVPLAPLHMPAAISCIEEINLLRPDAPQVCCFDTTFFAQLPELVRRLPLPAALYDNGIHRYGFHGLSYESIVELSGLARTGRAVLAHLGSGASMVAMREGVPIDTTMGFTPSGGFMMGTRSGDLDPGLIVYLLNGGYDARTLDRLVNQEAGLLGVSGVSGDMRVILERRSRDERSALAFEMFCYQARKMIGALTAALGGIDTLVFTGGSGEHAAAVRERICTGLSVLGIQLDVARNRSESAEIISADDSSCRIHVVAAQEEHVIARRTRQVLGF